MAGLKRFDVIINGAGVAGLTLAIALSKQDFSVLLVDPREALGELDDNIDLRVRAINESSRKILSNLGVWQRLDAARYGRFESVEVWNQEGAVHYDASLSGASFLSAVVEEKQLLLALEQALNETSVQRVYAKARHLKQFTDSVIVLLDNDERYEASVLVGADGAHSWVREAAGIALKTKSYGQSGLVATVKHEKPHAHCACQRFMPTGPLVFLPLADLHGSSIVWSLPNEQTQGYCELDKAVFNKALEHAFESRLGEVSVQSERVAFPLIERLAASFVAPHIALVSDAAHTMHPLAGLGLNLGLMDVAWLVDVLNKAKTEHLPIGDERILVRYHQARVFPVLKLQKTMAAFQALFSNNNQLLDILRNKGLELTDTQAWLKRLLLLEAQMLEACPPSLVRRVP
ncbi:MAG: hypothetical protein COV52_09295 [Gammaproteobacteria bacterium CG11_big_fil_rev_8_21_14_0_20_46_22]|nr:MAG: hypothetical protein COW05_07035 [Gammaproteobacteria bacterium CG12_big_fil_rev_8_21_14_0_65_46_12]PIR10326.1 MAG: hypothetical protein COV52_09295 [Gammaproteobacteria bacterium CG11_big_fil_rev_8_21_14_0_20_46_22]